MRGLLGEKVGMTAIFDDTGRQIAVTVVKVSGNVVVDKRTEDRDGYSALVLGFGEKNVKRFNKPELGYLEKQGVVVESGDKRTSKRFLREFRVSAEELAEYEIGQAIDAESVLKSTERVDVVGTSKGRGFTGVMMRYNFRGGKATHGVHEYYRHGGSIGSNTTPARVFKNKKMPGQHGNTRTTVQNIQVVEVRPDDGLMLLRGGLPGPKGGLLMIKRPVKLSPGQL